MENNFNEEILEELEKAGIEHGNIVPIPKEMKGTPEDYAELERKIIYETKQHETYVQ